MSPIPPLVPGYPRLAHEMSSIPETAVFRRFADLNHQSLLYYQAELTILERQLRQQELESSDPHAVRVNAAPSPIGTTAEGGEEATYIEYATRLEYAKNWYWLGGDDPGNKQWQTVLRVREVLREYSQALVLQSQLLALPAPNACDLSYLRAWLQKSINDDPATALNGWDSSSWDTDGGGRDLLALHSRPNSDPFSTWVLEHGVGWLYRRLWYRLPLPLYRRRGDGLALCDSSVLRVTALFATALASLLPVGSIAVLYVVTSMKARLGLVALFTFLSAVALSGCTTAGRGEVFGITAAFAAVQVVFIAGNGPSVVCGGD